MSTDVSEVRAASIFMAIALMMEAARTCETSVDIQLRTRQYIPEDSELHTRRREKIKSQIEDVSFFVFIVYLKEMVFFFAGNLNPDRKFS
jgi:hypothetical protein